MRKVHYPCSLAFLSISNISAPVKCRSSSELTTGLTSAGVDPSLLPPGVMTCPGDPVGSFGFDAAISCCSPVGSCSSTLQPNGGSGGSLAHSLFHGVPIFGPLGPSSTLLGILYRPPLGGSERSDR